MWILSKTYVWERERESWSINLVCKFGFNLNPWDIIRL